MSDERQSAEGADTQSPEPSAEDAPRARPEDAAHLSGAAFRKRLLGRLAPMPHRASRVRDAIEVAGGEETLHAALELDADAFLEPLWALTEGKLS